VDWDGFATAAANNRWFEDDVSTLPRFFELYSLPKVCAHVWTRE
jgi:hypothetical protein